MEKKTAKNKAIPLDKPKIDKKKDYQLRKQSKNRIAWINKRFKQIEKEIKIKESIMHDINNKSNATLLNELMAEISQFEDEYFQLVEELEKLKIIEN